MFATTADMVRRGLEVGAKTGLELLIEWNTFTIDEFHKTGAAVDRRHSTRIPTALEDAW